MRIEYENAYYEGDANASGDPHGKGKMVWDDGAKYEGDFVNGARHGNGELYLANGASYMGEFANDTCTGEGTFFSADNNTVIKGTFDNLKLINGMYHQSVDEFDDRDLITIFENGEAVSQYIQFDDGRVYYGERKGLVPHGYGMLVNENGEKTIGKFEDGEIVG